MTKASGKPPSFLGTPRKTVEVGLGTVVVCALTSNLKRAQVPGDVLLEEGEANLPKRSVAVVSQLISLSDERVRQILQGIFLLLEPRDLEG